MRGSVTVQWAAFETIRIQNKPFMAAKLAQLSGLAGELESESKNQGSNPHHTFAVFLLCSNIKFKVYFVNKLKSRIKKQWLNTKKY